MNSFKCLTFGGLTTSSAEDGTYDGTQEQRTDDDDGTADGTADGTDGGRTTTTGHGQRRRDGRIEDDDGDDGT